MKPQLNLMRFLMFLSLVILLSLIFFVPPKSDRVVGLMIFDTWVLMSTSCTLFLYSHTKILAHKHENRHAIFADSLRRGLSLGTGLALFLLLRYLELASFLTLLLLMSLLVGFEVAFSRRLLDIRKQASEKEDVLESGL